MNAWKFSALYSGTQWLKIYFPGTVLMVQTSSRLSLQIKTFWASLNIILIPARTEMRCKYEEATWGSKITKTLKLDDINRQHSERNACYGDNSVIQLPADFVFLQFSNPDGNVINRMSPFRTSCFFDLKPPEFDTVVNFQTFSMRHN
jgi:hypothetical protein